jgi:galactose oxidase
MAVQRINQSINQTFHFERKVFALQAPVAITGQQSGQCVHVSGVSQAAGGPVVQWPCTGGGNDTWTLKPMGQALDMFCSGTALLPDGRVFVNGGIDSTRTSIYDPNSRARSAAATMNIGRGCQGTVLNADGSVLTLGGSWSGGAAGGRSGELWNGSSWLMLPGVPANPILTADAQGLYRADNHLWLHTLSAQRRLHSGPSQAMHWIAPKANGGQGTITSAGTRADDGDSMNGNAVQFDVDQILKLGGALNCNNSDATRSTLLINAKGTNPQVTRVAPMAYARAFANSVVLPNGQVVVTGGQTYAVPFSDDIAVYVPELWDLVTQVFERLPAMVTPCNCHSVSLLLPDARVWVAGGGLCGGRATNHANYEILTQPYLLNSKGSVATRPTITSVSTTTPALGAVLTVTTNTPVSSFALVRLASVTHSVNNEQRRVPLVHNTTDGGTYSMALPSDPGALVPGLLDAVCDERQGRAQRGQQLACAALTLC